MSKLDLSQYKPSGESAEQRQKQIMEQALKNTDLRVERSVPLQNGSKIPEKGQTNHTDPSNHSKPTHIEGNYSIHTGDGLIGVDIDNQEELPGKIEQNLPATFTVETPHGGEHLLYQIEDDTEIRSTKLPNNAGDLQYDGKYVVGPGSRVDHSRCSDGKEECPGIGSDRYEAKTHSIAMLTEGENGDLLETFRNLGSSPSSKSTKSNTKRTEIEPLDQTNAEQEADWFLQFLHNQVGNAGRKAMNDVLKGGNGRILPESDDTTIDRDKSDLYALQRLYGAFIFRGDEEDEARQNALDVFRLYCREHKYHDTGEPRKALERNNPDKYLQSVMDAAQDDFDKGEWYRWLHWERSGSIHPELKPDGPSFISKATVLAAIQYLISLGDGFDMPIQALEEVFQADFLRIGRKDVGDRLQVVTPNQPYTSLHPPWSDSTSTDSPDVRRFPTRREIQEVATMLNPERQASYFRNVLGELVNSEDPLMRVVHAECPSRPSGHRHVYYLDHYDDPEDAEVVKIEGKELEPGSREPINGESSIDGGHSNSSNSWIPDDGRGCNQVPTGRQ